MRSAITRRHGSLSRFASSFRVARVSAHDGPRCSRNGPELGTLLDGQAQHSSSRRTFSGPSCMQAADHRKLSSSPMVIRSVIRREYEQVFAERKPLAPETGADPGGLVSWCAPGGGLDES
jgi:hypothetical protein